MGVIQSAPASYEVRATPTHTYWSHLPINDLRNSPAILQRAKPEGAFELLREVRRPRIAASVGNLFDSEARVGEKHLGFSETNVSQGIVGTASRSLV